MTAIPSAAPGHDAVPSVVSPQRQRAGSLLIRVSTILLGLLILGRRSLRRASISFGFANWQPILLAYILWSVGPVLGPDPARRRSMAGVRSSCCPPFCSRWRWSYSPRSSASSSPSATGTCNPRAGGSSMDWPISTSSSPTRISGTRSATWCSMCRRCWCNMPSPSGWRFCSTPISRRRNSSASPSSCLSCCLPLR